MEQAALIGLASVIILGILAQWLAWRLAMPSILLLLVLGFVAGPVTGFLDPDKLFGPLLFPLVSISVGIILFEGGLSLKFAELKQIGTAIRNLVTIGVVASWLPIAVLAHWILDLDWSLSFLLGSILVVTGPTVIGPLLLQIRPAGKSGPILKWESILIDPVGATLAVLVFEVIFESGQGSRMGIVVFGVLKTILIGGGLGAFFAWILYEFLRRYWIPEYLENPFAFMLVVTAFSLSNWLQHESGLLATTVMGILLINQKTVDVRRVIEFKENLRVLLISSLFILLVSRLDWQLLKNLSPWSALFLLALIFFVRPLSVFVSTMKSRLSWAERGFIAWMAPRGIVAAAVSAIFAERLHVAGYVQAGQLVPITFLVIATTVALYGLTSGPVARWLKLADPDPQGVLFVGINPLSVQIAKILKEEGFAIHFIDNNYQQVSEARMAGLPCYYGNILSESILEEIDLGGVGKMFAVTPNAQVNALASLHCSEVFGRSQVFQLPEPQKGKGHKDSSATRRLRGRYLFSHDAIYHRLMERFRSGASVKKTRLSNEFDYEAYLKQAPADTLPLLLIRETRRLVPFSPEADPITPQPGQILISLVEDQKNSESGSSKEMKKMQ